MQHKDVMNGELGKTCPTCKEAYDNIGHPVREGVVIARVCKCTRKTDPAPPVLSYEELVRACKNIGFDLSCGRCAGIFFTGVASEAHDERCFTTGARILTRIT